MREEYGPNLILNPSADSGLENWTAQGVARTTGGSDGPYSFRLAETASMWQELGEADLILKPPDFKVAVDLKFPPAAPAGTSILGRILIQFGYVGDTIDSFIIPCHPGLLSSAEPLGAGWYRVEQICPVNEKLVLRAARISIITEGLPGGLQVDNIQVRKNLDIWEEIYEEAPWVEQFRDKSILYGLDADKPVLR